MRNMKNLDPLKLKNVRILNQLSHSLKREITQAHFPEQDFSQKTSFTI